MTMLQLPISADAVAAQLAEAGATLRALSVPGCGPAGYASAWPSFRADPSGEPPLGGARDTSARPSPQAISMMERTLLVWPQLIPADQVRERRAVLLRAQGWSWRRLAVDIGLSHIGARKLHHRAVTWIAAVLNRDRHSVPMRLP